MQYFEDNCFIAIDNFKLELGRYFGLEIVDTDEDLQDREYRKNKKKKERPSIRNMTPLCCNIKTLIANKHAIFIGLMKKKKRADYRAI